MGSRQTENRDEDLLLKGLLGIIGEGKGANLLTDTRFEEAEAVYELTVHRLSLGNLPSSTTRGKVVKTFLDEAMSASSFPLNDEVRSRSLAAARELFGFSRFTAAEIKAIIGEHGDVLPPRQSYPINSMTVRLHLAKLARIGYLPNDPIPSVSKDQAAVRREVETWVRAAASALLNFLDNSRKEARALAAELGFLKVTTFESGELPKDRVGRKEEGLEQLNAALDASRRNRESLRAIDVVDEVPREIVGLNIVPGLLGQQDPTIIAVRGDAGAGKTVIAGQSHDAISQGNDVVSLLLPCQDLDRLPDNADDFELQLGALTGYAGDLSELTTLSVERGKTTVAVFDTIDVVLNEKTQKIIIGVFKKILSTGASVVFTCRHHDYGFWFRHAQNKFGTAKAMTVADVEPLQSGEVKRIVSGFARTHEPDNVYVNEFTERILDLADRRPAVNVIVTRPFLLIMLCQTYLRGGVIPPDLTTTRLCRAYEMAKISQSRKYGPRHAVSLQKRELWLDVAKELWHLSADKIALSLGEYWFKNKADEQEALQDLLSEEILIRRSVDHPVISFQHQFLAEYSMAVHLRERAIDELHDVLEELHESPMLRYFAWQVVRHAIAGAPTDDIVRSLIGKIDLNEVSGFHAVVRGVAEQIEGNFLIELSEYRQHHEAWFQYEVFHFIPDEKIDDALTVLAGMISQGADVTVRRAVAAAGRLLPRCRDKIWSNLPKVIEVVNAIADIREGKAEAVPKDGGWVDQLLEALLAPVIGTGIALPDSVLTRCRDFLSGSSAIGFTSVIRAHLQEGVSVDQRRRLLDKVFSFRLIDKIAIDGARLVVASATWDTEEVVAEDYSFSWESARPLALLNKGRGKGKLPAAALARAANLNPALRSVVVNIFLEAADKKVRDRILICAQEVVKAGGEAWLFDEFKGRASDELQKVEGPLSGLLKLDSFDDRRPHVRHKWANWFKGIMSGSRVSSVDALLRLGWDDEKLNPYCKRLMVSLTESEVESILANFARRATSPAKADVVDELSTLVKNIDSTPLLRARVVNVAREEPSEKISDLVESESSLVSAQALFKIETATRSGSDWITPEFLEKYAQHASKRVRVGILKALALVIERQVDEVDSVLLAWLLGANDRALGRDGSVDEELIQLVKASHSYLRDNFGSNLATLKELFTFVTGVVAVAEQNREIHRELLALIRTASWRADSITRGRAASWIFSFLDKVDPESVREGVGLMKPTLVHLLENRDITFEAVVERARRWRAGALVAVVDLIASDHPDGVESALFDDILQFDLGGIVKAHIAYHRQKDRY